jgi:repressor of nif and glnA expression
MAESNLRSPQDHPADSTRAPDDEVFSVLADCRRRQILRYLHESDSPEGIESIADAIEDRHSAPPRRELRIALHHKHLPKLDAAGLIEYAAGDNRVVDADGIESVESYLDTAEDLGGF